GADRGAWPPADARPHPIPLPKGRGTLKRDVASDGRRYLTGGWPGGLRLRASGEHSSFLDPLQLEVVWWAQTARVERAHYPSVAATIDSVCALREHLTPPDPLKPASAVADARPPAATCPPRPPRVH